MIAFPDLVTSHGPQKQAIQKGLNHELKQVKNGYSQNDQKWFSKPIIA